MTDGAATSVTSTQNGEAYNEYLKGLDSLRTRELDAVETAHRHFAAATALDPYFAEAWARQAFATHLQSDSNGGDIPRAEAKKLATTLIERAFDIEPDLAEAHAVMAILLEDDYRYEEALESNARAIEAQPNFAEAYLWRASLLESIGRISEADAAVEKAYELDKLHPSIALSRRLSPCRFYRPRLSADALRAITESDDEWGAATSLCNAQSGNYATAFEATDDAVRRRYIGVWTLGQSQGLRSAHRGAESGIQSIMALVALPQGRGSARSIRDAL